MSKITVNTLWTSRDALDRLGKMDLPISVGLKLAVAVERIIDVLKAPDKIRTQILTKYGEKDKDHPDMVNIRPENISKYQEDMEALLGSEIEVDLPDVKASELGSTIEEAKKVKFSTSDLIALKYLIQRDL